ncbi:MAG: hypothetical protein U0414_41935 [Polyangiaceae bacterium]
MSARAALLGMCLAFVVARSARAEETVGFAPSACPSFPFDLPAFEALLRIELAESAVTIGPRGRSTLFVDVAACDPSGATPVLLTFSGPPAKSRAVALADVDAAVRARVLALAAAEFVNAGIASREPALPVQSSSPAAPLPSAPSPQPTLPVAAPTYGPVPVAPEPRPKMRAFTAALAFAVRDFPIDETPLTGLELRGSIKLVGPLRLRTEILGFYAREDHPLGVVHLAGGAGAIGLSLGARGDVVGFDVGPRLDVGGLLLEAHAAPGAARLSDDTAAPFVGLGLDAEADFYPTPGFFVVTGIEAGGALAGATGTAGGVRVIGASGPFFGLRLGVGTAP